MQIAQTPVALFNQMREHDRTGADIELVRKAYDLGVELYSGRFEADGSPFQVHGVGTASILCQLGLPAWVMAAACLHNAYGSGDFGDGRGRGPFPNRRELVRSRLGEPAEAFLRDLYGNRLDRKTLSGILEKCAHISEREHLLLTHDLADLLEKWFDGGILYTRPDRRDRNFVCGHEQEIVALAERLGHPSLAQALREAFARYRLDAAQGEGGWDRTYSRVIAPRSLTKRLRVRALGFRWDLYVAIRRIARQAARSWLVR